jgi:hypothetical protein
MTNLLELADRVESGEGDVRALNREVALANGWHRYSPSEISKSNPGWIAPEDFIGENVGEDGRRHPVLDSLHGTTIWREPRAYLAAFDAALSLCSDESASEILNEAMEALSVAGWRKGQYVQTLTHFVVAACLRARAEMVK